MEAIIETFKNTGALHHAYLIEGDRSEISTRLLEFLEKDFGVGIQGNPDFSRVEFEVMGIEDARELAAAEQNRAFGGGKKVFVMETGSITIEAQNSLLKVLEEPTEGTHFFFLMPTAERLLPTLRSRLQIVRLEEGRTSELAEAKKFLAGSGAERAEFLKPLIESKDKLQALLFVESLERVLHDTTDFANAKPERIFALSELEKGRQYLLDRSPSVKMILEHIAAVI